MFGLGASGGDCDVEKEKPRLLPGLVPNFAQLLSAFPQVGGMRPFQAPVTSSPGGTGVFPMFPQNLTPFLFQQMMQQNQMYAQLSKSGCFPDFGDTTSSSGLSDSRASSADSASKKLQVDSEGNVICPICEQKLPADSKWEQHVEMERNKLVQIIEKIKQHKDTRSEADGSLSRSRQKREGELQRIRSNQQKRLAWKSVSPLAARNSVDSQFDSNRSTCADKNFCRCCERQHEFLVINASLDEPRCLECFRKYRRQTNFLPSSFTESSPVEENTRPSSSSSLNHTVEELLGSSLLSGALRKRSPTDSPVEEGASPKRVKLEP